MGLLRMVILEVDCLRGVVCFKLEFMGVGLLRMCSVFTGRRAFILAVGDYYDRFVYKLCWVFCDSLKNEYFCNLDDCWYLRPCAVCRRGGCKCFC